MLVARAGHPLRAHSLPGLLQAVPLILPPEGALIRRAVNDFLATLGLPALRPVAARLTTDPDPAVADAALWAVNRLQR